MPSKKPPYTLVVPQPIPDEVLQRVSSPRFIPTNADTKLVPGLPVVVGGDPGEDPVEMIDGAPAPVISRPPTTPPALRMVEEWPIHLSAQTLLQPGKNGSPSLQSLRAPQGAWLRIDEIKFEVLVLPSDNTDLTLATYTAEGFGAVIGVNLALQGKPLTSGFVPMAMFGPSRKLVHERQIFNGPSNTQARVEQYVWPLSKPVYVPPGTVLEPVFEHKGYINYKVRARISYAGALLKRAPNPVDIGKLPFASAWVGPTITLDGTGQVIQSDESSLVGPPGREFNVEYMIGRMYLRLQTSDYAALVESDFDTAGPFPGGAFCQYTKSTQKMQVQVMSSWGSPLTPNHISWWALFDRVNRQLEAAHQMPIDGYYTVEVGDTGGAVINTAALPIVSLVGWQEVAP